MLTRICVAAVLALSWAGVSSATEVRVRALGSFVLSEGQDVADLNGLRSRDSTVDFARGRLFVDAGTQRTALFSQFIVSDVARDPVRIFGFYLQHQLFEDQQHFVQVGKIPLTEGTWGPRTYEDQNPLVGVPFAYYWQSSLPVNAVPTDLDELVARTDARNTYGALMLYDNCWNEGVSMLGAHGQFAYALAATRGAPGNPAFGGSENDDIGLHAKVTWSPVAEMQCSVSWGRGAYLTRSAADSLTPAQSINDYHQNLWVGSLRLARGYLEFNGEFFWNDYETPLTSDGLSSWSAYGDLEWNFAVGWHFAVRYDTMRFGDVETSAGIRPWDQNLERIEAGVGYDVNRNFTIKGVVQATDVGNGYGEETVFPMIQAVVSF